MFLDPQQELRQPPRRVLVAGATGAGKTTLAARLSEVLDVPHVELDALFHGPRWTPRPTFPADVAAFSAGPRWVTEWQYAAARPVLADRADLVVWLDLSRRAVLRQVVLRTLRRRLRRQVLWSGNVEPPLRTFFTDPEHIVRWAWSTYAKPERLVVALQDRRPDLPVVRLRDRRSVCRWVEGPLQRAVSGSGRSGR